MAEKAINFHINKDNISYAKLYEHQNNYIVEVLFKNMEEPYKFIFRTLKKAQKLFKQCK